MLETKIAACEPLRKKLYTFCNIELIKNNNKQSVVELGFTFMFTDFIVD